MRKINIFFLVALFVNTCLVAQHINVIPQPLSVQKGKGDFNLNQNTSIAADELNQNNVAYLQSILHTVFKKSLKVNRKRVNVINLKVDSSLLEELGSEGYYLEVNKKNISIKGATDTGVFYGIQTLRQLIPLNVEKGLKTLSIPMLKIKDKPRFSWRAFMLDEARYFKGTKEVKKILDQMALLKMNVFHWHLTDDQGWRIQIKKYPKLTEVGSYRSNSQIGGWDSEERSGEIHKGYYTQDQIRDIIAYASERNITIVPEIEMPGHASAAIAAYPWLGTIGELKEVPVVFGKLPDSYNVADPRVYEFIENVLQEVMELFPGKVIHIGGDEVKFGAWKNSIEVQRFMKENGLKTPADLQIFFTNRISNFIDKSGHRMMGWNEILGGNVHEWQKADDVKVREKLAESAIIHFWKGSTDLIIQAVTNGYDIVNSHHVYTYLDYSYKYIPIEKAYEFDPIPEKLDNEYHAKVLGMGCQMWGEWIPDTEDMESMIFPRLAAYAEVGWTKKNRKNYNVFRSNLNSMLKRWELEGIKYSGKFEEKDFVESN